MLTTITNESSLPFQFIVGFESINVKFMDKSSDCKGLQRPAKANSLTDTLIRLINRIICKASLNYSIVVDTLFGLQRTNQSWLSQY